MTRLAIAINLDRCVGCHTCALSCKMQNNVPEGMLWNRVLTEDCDVVDGALGTYPNVTRTFLPVACQHCQNAACQRVWRILTGPNPTSPLLWDVCVITCYLIINVFYLVFMTRGNQHAVSIVSRFALPCAILVHSVTAWIFGLEAAKEGWYTAIMAPIFVASAMDSGLALLLVVLGVLKKAGIYDTSRELMAMLAGLLCTCVAVDAFFIFCEVLTMAYPGAAGAETLALLTTGPTAPFFWFEIICGLVIPFCILVFAKNRQSAVLINVACVLIVVGVFCKRVWLLFTAFIVPNVMGAPGIISGSSEAAHATGTASFAVLSSYAPTPIEILVVAGVISLVILAFMVLASKLIVERREK